jgi:hypothetical protein
VADRKPFLVRMDPGVHEALERWARDDMRSVNAQVEYVIREALRKAGRLGADRPSAAPPPPRRNPGPGAGV